MENVDKSNNFQKDDLAFHSLSPIADEKSHKNYCDALEWALLNREKKDIKNIALTGNYGSGKSSILKTLENRKIEGLHFLKISLATFKEEKTEKKTPQTSTQENINQPQNPQKSEKGENKKQIPTNEQLRLIELSILQQIIYHESNENIPHSRFKKIRSLKPEEIKNTTIQISFLIISFCLLFYLDKLKTILGLPELLDWSRYVVLFASLIVFIWISFLLLKRTISLFQKLSVIKLNFQNIEIQINEKLDKSILNNHIDEILYFFEATSYNVVIIEDLDRFEQTEIFTKLREINLLINNSESVDRRVVFIYAVRDEIFKQNDRTKFFDFIVPVIPIVNHTNSNEKLKEALTDFKYNISESLVNEISFFLNDMRILYNSVNEFHIYYQEFKGASNQGIDFIDKLFAIIVYKNLNPEDFVNLGKGKGVLYRYLTKMKTTWINNAESQLTNEKKSIEEKLSSSEEEIVSNLKDLRSIYLFEFIKDTNELMDIKIGNEIHKLSSMSEEENFEKLLENKIIKYRSLRNGRVMELDFPLSFNEIERKIDPKYQYIERKEFIKNKAIKEKDELIRQLKRKEREIREVKSIKIKKLAKYDDFPLPDSGVQERLIALLVRNGYIAEDYLNYISYFYPGSITEQDHWFIMNVKNETLTEFNYKLNQVANVIEKLNKAEFDNKFILNFSLLDYLLDNWENHKEKGEIFLRNLSSEEDIETVKFIKAYINRGILLDKFIKYISHYWWNIWKFFEDNLSMSENEKEKLHYLILNFTDIKDLKNIEANSSMMNFIERKPDFIDKIETTKKVKEIIKAFNIKFTNLAFKNTTKEIKDFIYLNDYYAINPNTIEKIVKHYGKFDKQKFPIANYSSILNSGAENLIKYIDQNIKTYINDVFLDLEQNKNEPNDSLIKLLNHSDVKLESKKNIIKFSNTKISDISKLNSPLELFDYLLNENKIQANWENIKFIYSNNTNEKFPDSLIKFLNIDKNANALSSKKYKLSESDETDEFQRHFLSLNKIKDNLYSKYLNAFSQPCNNLDLPSLTKEKISSLIRTKKLVFNLTNYNIIKKNFSPLNISFIIENYGDFIKDFNDYDLSQSELEKLVSSKKLNDLMKIKTIELFHREKENITEEKILNVLGELYIKYSAIEISGEILKYVIFNSTMKVENKIKLFMRDEEIYNNNDLIFKFLNSLGGKFMELNKRGPMPSFDNNRELGIFFNHLKIKGLISNVIPKNNTLKVTTLKK